LSLVTHRARLVVLLVGLLALTGAAGVHAARTAAPSLTLNVSTNGALEIVLGNGTRLRTATAPGASIPPGPYLAIVASDVPDSQDIFHMFHLFGPGVNLSSDLLPCENPAPVNTVTLQPGATYTYEDSRHPDITHVVFTTSVSGSSADTVGSAGGPATAKTTGSVGNSSVVGSGIKNVRGTLAATITAAGGLSVSLNGKGLSRLKAGRYAIAVDDRTRRDGLTIGRLHASPVVVTGPSFTGRHTVTMYLAAGRWSAYASPRAKRVFTVVA